MNPMQELDGLVEPLYSNAFDFREKLSGAYQKLADKAKPLTKRLEVDNLRENFRKDFERMYNKVGMGLLITVAASDACVLAYNTVNPLVVDNVLTTRPETVPFVYFAFSALAACILMIVMRPYARRYFEKH